MKNVTKFAARYAVIFAADVEPEAYQAATVTDDFEELAINIGIKADELNEEAKKANEDFWPVLFVETAAQAFNSMPIEKRGAQQR